DVGGTPPEASVASSWGVRAPLLSSLVVDFFPALRAALMPAETTRSANKQADSARFTGEVFSQVGQSPGLRCSQGSFSSGDDTCRGKFSAHEALLQATVGMSNYAMRQLGPQGDASYFIEMVLGLNPKDAEAATYENMIRNLVKLGLESPGGTGGTRMPLPRPSMCPQSMHPGVAEAWSQRLQPEVDSLFSKVGGDVADSSELVLSFLSRKQESPCRESESGEAY
ncbi:unnamed protein product, partial [Amoebophrya sp. A25]